MAGRKKGAVPGLLRHKASRRAFVRLNGDNHYVGSWPEDTAEAPPEARAAYDELIARWLVNQRRPLPTPEQQKRRALHEDVEDPSAGLTVAELILRYLDHARTYYAHPDGSPTSEYSEYVNTLRPVNHSFGPTPAAEFGPLKLKAVRELMVRGYEHPRYGPQAKLSRKVINHRCRRITRMFRWAAGEELVKAEVADALRNVAGLAKGRTEARETAPVLPVPVEVVENTLPHLTAHLQGAVRFQLLTGARPTEALCVSLTQIDRTGPVWVYRLDAHKTLHHGKARSVAIGPKAQAVLTEYIHIRCPHCGVEGRPPRIGSRDNALCGPCADRVEEQDICGPWQRVECQDAHARLFNPQVAMRERDEDRRAARKTKVQPSQKCRKKAGARRRPGTRYHVEGYNRAIERVCVAQDIPPWSPNQLRHTHGTQVRKRYGLEAAQVALGHSQANTTEVYAERDLTLAVKVAQEMG